MVVGNLDLPSFPHQTELLQIVEFLHFAVRASSDISSMWPQNEHLSERLDGSKSSFAPRAAHREFTTFRRRLGSVGCRLSCGSVDDDIK